MYVSLYATTQHAPFSDHATAREVEHRAGQNPDLMWISTTHCHKHIRSICTPATSARRAVRLLHNDSSSFRRCHTESSLLKHNTGMGSRAAGAAGALGRAARWWWRGRPAGAPSGGLPTWRRPAPRWHRRPPHSEALLPAALGGHLRAMRSVRRHTACLPYCCIL